MENEQIWNSLLSRLSGTSMELKTISEDKWFRASFVKEKGEEKIKISEPVLGLNRVAAKKNMYIAKTVFLALIDEFSGKYKLYMCTGEAKSLADTSKRKECAYALIKYIEQKPDFIPRTLQTAYRGDT